MRQLTLAALALTAGRYRIESRYGAINARTSRDIEIKPGASQPLVMELDAGLVTLKLSPGKPSPARAAPAAGAGPGADATGQPFWEILDADGRKIWSTVQPAPRLPLAAGRYLARVETSGGKAERIFQVAGGDDKTIEIELK